MKVIAWIILGWLILLGTIMLQGENVTVSWQPSTTVGVASYKIHYGQSKRTSGDPYQYAYPRVESVESTAQSVVLTNISPGVWYFSVTALFDGIDSYYSDPEVAYTNRSFAPINVRITGPAAPLALQSTTDGVYWRTLAFLSPDDPPVQLPMLAHEMFRVKQ